MIFTNHHWEEYNVKNNIYVIRLKHLILFCCAFLLVIGIGAGIAVSAVQTSGSAGETVRVPILMYHSILKNTRGSKYIISPDAFESDLKFLQAHGYTPIVMQDLIDYVYEGTALPQKPIILTFDDGHYNNYVYIYPLLKKYNAKAVISIVGSYTDMYTENPDTNANYAHLAWDTLKEMQNSGYVEIQNHTYNLHSLDKGRSGCKKKRGESLADYTSLLTHDIGSLQEKCTQQLGYTPTTFTYPFGSVSNDSFEIIKSLGFTASLSCQEGINELTRRPEELYMLKRCLRTPSKSAATILKE